MFEFSKIVAHDLRVNLRIPEKKLVVWRIKDNNIWGYGKIRNISTSGMLLETNFKDLPAANTVFSFDADLGSDNYIPENGRLVWSKPKGKSANHFLLGIKFLEPSGFILAKLKQRIQQGITSLSIQRRCEVWANPVIFLAVIFLTVFITRQNNLIYENMLRTNQQLMDISSQQAALTQSYAHRYYATEMVLTSVQHELAMTKQMYQENQNLLNGAKQELATTKSILTQTESMLAQSNTEKAQLITEKSKLMSEVQSLKDSNQAEVEKTRSEMKSMVTLLQQKNIEISDEMVGLEKKLNFLEGAVDNSEEGKMLLAIYRHNMDRIREKIKYYQDQAFVARINAQKERDRIRTALGNNGYFVRGGSVVDVDLQKFESATDGDLKPAEGAAGSSPAPARKVSVGVKFVD